MEGRYKNLKLFWKKKILEEQNDFKIPADKTMSEYDLVVKLGNLSELKDIREFVHDRRKSNRLNSTNWRKHYLSSLHPDPLSNEEKIEQLKELKKDAEDLDMERKEELTRIKVDSQSYKDSLESYEEGLKKIIGADNLNNWESKVVKAGSSNKDTADSYLQTQITNLTKLKEETEKQLKEKQDQILNHRCDTPNNAELNQTKEELNKTNKEIIFLKEQLDNKPNNPLPNSPNDDKEEEKKEEQENNNLTLEQLKAKLNAKRQEIKMLKEQLNKTNKISQSDNHSHQNSSGNSKIFLGIVIGILIIVAFKGLAFIISKKKKKTVNIWNQPPL